MNKVTTINLAGTAYQLEEPGYEKLRAYLNDATAKLGADPDKDEIIQDLERAIAEKCNTYLLNGKNVVTASEVDQIIADMGPVHAASSSEESEEPSSKSSDSSPKRLYRIHEGGMFLGVCSGLAAYFDIDVVLVRIIFILLALVTHGFAFLAYFVMAIIVPRADTPEKRAAAYGVPFSTQEFISRAQELRDEIKANSKEWKRYRKSLKRNMRMQHPYHGSPFVGLIMGALSLLWAFALISVITTHGIFGFALPAAMPLWLAIVLLCVVYGVIISPIRWSIYANYAYASGEKYPHQDPPGPIGFVMQVLLIWFVGWLLYTYVPTVHEFLNTVWQTIQNTGVLK